MVLHYCYLKNLLNAVKFSLNFVVVMALHCTPRDFKSPKSRMYVSRCQNIHWNYNPIVVEVIKRNPRPKKQ